MNLRTTVLSPYRSKGQPITTSGDSALNWYTHGLAASLVSAGVDVTVIAPRDHRATRWMDGSVLIVPSYNRGSPWAASQILLALFNRRNGIVHVQHELFAYGGIVTAFLLPLVMTICRANGIKIVTTYHGLPPKGAMSSDFLKANGITAPRALVRKAVQALGISLVRASDIVIVHGKSQRSTLISEYAADPTKVQIIPIGVSAKATCVSRAQARSALKIPISTTVLMFFGHLAPYKGVDLLLPAVEKWLDGGADRFFLLAGSAPARYGGASLQYCSLLNNVRFRPLGFVPDEQVDTVFSASDALVLPYTVNMAASGPMNIAFGCGLPVLASSVFADDISLSTFFAPNADALFSIMERFTSDLSLRALARRESKDIAAGRSWSTIARQTAMVYERALFD